MQALQHDWYKNQKPGSISQKSTRNFRDKLQFVNLTKRLMFDLTKILLSKSLISTAVESNYLNIFGAA